jgi:Rrf2 family protein
MPLSLCVPVRYRYWVRVSRKTDYALRVLFTLVDHYGRPPISIRELAITNEVPKRFLEQIMLELKAKGWVDSLPGTRGGYFLTQPPQKITIRQVLRHFDGIIAPVGCVSVTGYEPCALEKVCRFRRVLLKARNYVADLMDSATLADVAQGTPVSKQEVGATFSSGEGI